MRTRAWHLCEFYLLTSPFFIQGVIWVYTVLGPVHFVYLRGVWCTLSFFFFFQYKVCVLRCLSRLYTVYLSPALYCLAKSFFLYLWGGWQYKATNRILKISIECQNLTETVDVFWYNFHSFMVNHQFNIITDFSLALSKYSIQTQPMYPALF